MIQIKVERGEQGQVERVFITGHADYGEYGRDIVCAAVSGISIGMVNAIEQLFCIQIHADDDNPGKLDCRLPKHLEETETLAKIELLLEALVVSLKNVADEYPAYVKIRERKST